MAEKKITMSRVNHEYPTVVVMVTDNPKYLDGRQTFEVDDAVRRFKNWLEKAVNGTEAKVQTAKQSQVSSK